VSRAVLFLDAKGFPEMMKDLFVTNDLPEPFFQRHPGPAHGALEKVGDRVLWLDSLEIGGNDG
jgi:hypothetical protein